MFLPFPPEFLFLFILFSIFHFGDFLQTFEDLEIIFAAAAAESLESCLTLCDPIDGSPPSSHRWQPTKLSRPWDSPGKSAGVGCHFLLQCVKVKSEREVAQSCPRYPGSSVSKETACRCRRTGSNPWVRKIPWRRKWQPTPVFLPGKPHGQRSLVGYSPWGCMSRTQLSA